MPTSGVGKYAFRFYLKEVLSFCNVNGKTFWLVTV